MIYERIKRLCKVRQMTVRQLELACGLSNGSIRKWAKASPSAESLYKVAQRLGVNMEELIGDEK